MKRFTRRNFIRGAGGLGLALPLVGTDFWLAKEAIAQGANGAMTADGFPKRFIYFFHPNGTEQDVFWPTGEGTNFELSEILSPLNAHKSKLIIPKGIEIKAAHREWGPGGPHQRGMGAVLSGVPLQEGDFIGGDGSRAGWGDGITIDQVLANHIGATSPRKSMHLGVRADTSTTLAEVRSRLSYSGPGRPVDPQNDPLNVFNDVFANLMVDPSERAEIVAKRKSILDAVGDQYEIVRKRAGDEDKQRLDAHLSMIRDLEVRLDTDGVTGEACYAPTQPNQMQTDSEDTMPLISRLQIDLLVAAMACDQTRVGSIQYSNAKNHIAFPWLDSTRDGHSLSHAGPSDDESKQQWIKRDRWFAGEFAYLLSKLDSIQEGAGTMLDNTCVLWINEISEGSSHSHVNMPFVLAGSAGGALKTGQFIDYGNVPHNNLLVSIQNAYGIDSDTIGDPRFVDGPLTGLM